MKESHPYIGRFAPSPSGPLHFGSLVAALASYLDARSNHGQWLVRMEDIDPPREQAGAADTILKALDVYGLHWDGEVLYQSSRYDAYQQAISELTSKNLIYPCTCTRKDLRGYGGIYPGLCRARSDEPEQPYSLRVRCKEEIVRFEDPIQGDLSFALPDLGDFIIKRKDGLIAYQLAVCVDDDFQNITDVVRGYDLLDATPWQIHLQSLMGYSHPQYAHVPVITLNEGEKLSKQNHAPEIPLDTPQPLLIKALSALGQNPGQELEGSSVADVIQWGVEHWQLDSVVKKPSISLSALP